MKLLLIGSLLISALALIDTDKSEPTTPSDSGCGRETAEYVGAESCKACHFGEYRSWKKTTMALTFDILKAGKAVDAKTLHGLDPAKDYSRDGTCLACHTTGYGKPGGYPAVVPDKPWTEEETSRAKRMEGVQCESCHGPGSLTGPLKKLNEKYKKAELLERGLIEPKAENCQLCHNDRSPTIPKDGYRFDYERLVKDEAKFHKRTPLKHPH